MKILTAVLMLLASVAGAQIAPEVEVVAPPVPTLRTRPATLWAWPGSCDLAMEPSAVLGRGRDRAAAERV